MANERLHPTMAQALKPFAPPASVELADDLRFIAAHEADPRKEDRIYEAADAIDALYEALENARNTLAGCGMARTAVSICDAALAKARGQSA